MTDRVIVATFNDSNSAYDAVSSLKGLKDAGEVNFKLKSGVMIHKDKKGNLELLESKGGTRLFGTAVGTAVGALIGLIGGAPGVVIGAALGATSGLASDTIMASLDVDFVNGVTKDMMPGKTAIIVEADEQSTATVDDIVSRKGGHVFRQTVH
jgi:uncharacterized membrane protein